MFVDCANYEYSRDIEMMRGGYFDNYYVKFCEYVAKLKGISPDVTCKPGETAVFHGFADGAMHRNHPGYDRTYENHTGRHSLKKLLVENCTDSLRFTIETGELIDTTDTEGTFLQIFVQPDVPGNGSYGYTVNVHPDFAAGTTTVLTPDGSVTVPLTCTDNTLTVTVPKTVLNGERLYMKACDSREAVTSAEDFYDHGDALPLGYADVCVIFE